MAGKLACVTALGMAAGAAAFTTPMAARFGMPATASKSAMMRPTLGAMPARLAPRLRMSSEPAAETDVDEYFGIDAEGNKVKLTTSAKERRYLDACNVSNIFDNVLFLCSRFRSYQLSSCLLYVHVFFGCS
jgi:hypothetical protein